MIQAGNDLSCEYHDSPMRILDVEDDRKVADFLQKGLEEEGYAVDVLNDGDEARRPTGVVPSRPR